MTLYVSSSSSAGVVYNVKSYGAVCNGVTDDSAAVQACVDDAASQTNGGTILFPGLTRLATGIRMPYTGNFRFTSLGAAGSASSYIATGSKPAGGIITTGDVAVPSGVGSTIAPEPANATFLFYAAGNSAITSPHPGALRILFENMLFYRTVTSGKPQAVYLDQLDQTGSLSFVGCELRNVGLFYHGAASVQMDTVRVLGNTIWHGGWIIDTAPPWMGEIAGNSLATLPGVGAANGGSWDNLSTSAQWIEASGWWSYYVHSNMISSGYGGNVMAFGTRPGAVIAMHTIEQTENAAIYNNNFFGCSDAAIYYKSSWPATADPQAGINIHDNQFTQWNVDNVSGALNAAIYIDAPGTGCITDLLIGPHQYCGGAHSGYGIVIVGDPVVHKGITINPQQVMGGIVTAPYRINGSNTGSPIAMTARMRVDPPSGVGVW